jgi:1-acyl-sn-glycerol-3-phosphate acyltransferase
MPTPDFSNGLWDGERVNPSPFVATKMKALLRWLVGWLFRFRAYNEEVLKAPGPVLLLPNHVSWLDWLFLLVCTDEDWK